jgi:hypothetical protein
VDGVIDHGGAAYFIATFFEMNRVYAARNILSTNAHGRGGAVAVEGTDLRITSSIFEHNVMNNALGW